MVLGISADPPQTQAGFKARQRLPFTLLSDTEKTVAEVYGTKRVIGVTRATFVIGEDGRIVKIFPRVQPRGHAREVLAVL